jgi:hypothetical protein
MNLSNQTLKESSSVNRRKKDQELRGEFLGPRSEKFKIESSASNESRAFVASRGLGFREGNLFADMALVLVNSGAFAGPGDADLSKKCPRFLDVLNLHHEACPIWHINAAPQTN